MGIKFLQNIDAERNKFEEAGFEVVDQLPTDNLFAGREVLFGGRKYLYNGSRWVQQIGATGSVNGFVKGNGAIEEDRIVTFYGTYKWSSDIGMKYRWIHLLNINPKNYGYGHDIYGLYSIILSDDSNITPSQTSFLLEFTRYLGNLNICIRSYRTSLDSLRFVVVMTSNGDVYLQSTIMWNCYAIVNKIERRGMGITSVYTISGEGYNYNEYPSEWADNVVMSMLQPSVVSCTLTEAGNAWKKRDTQPYNLYDKHYATNFVKINGTATQVLMADGSTKDISGFASSEDIPTQLPNPNPIIIKTADGVSVRYDGSTSGGVILEAGDNAELTATQDSDDTMTVKFGAVVPTKLPNPQALTIQVLDDAGALIGSDILYDGLIAKILKLVAGYGIKLNSVNLTGGQAVVINLKQIAGTTLLGNANGTTGTPQAVTMAQLRTMLGSLMLNDISVTLGGNSSYTLPCYIDYSGTRYQCRISSDATGLQIYRAGVWATIGKFCQCRTRGTITNSNLDSWYKDTEFNYEMDESVSKSLFTEDLTPKFGMSMAGAWTGKTVTLNLASVSIKDTKSAWDMLKKNMGDCFPRESVEKIRYYYNVAIPSGEVVTKIELSFFKGAGMCTVHFYTEG